MSGGRVNLGGASGIERPSAREASGPDVATLTARELGAAVTPLFILPNRFQQAALNELVIRCEVADRLLTARASREAGAQSKPESGAR